MYDAYEILEIMETIANLLRPSFFKTLFSIVSYFLLSIGYFTLAKRRRISHTWLAWLPVFNTFLLGYLSDDYQLREKHKATARGRWLVYLWFSFFSTLIAFIILIFAGAFESNSGFTVFLLVVGYITIAITSISFLVYFIMSLYDLYKSTVPQYAIPFVILSLVFNFLLPFFLFFVRNKGYGDDLSYDSAVHGPGSTRSAATDPSFKPSAKICPYCGESLSPEDVFCPGCGKKFVAPSSEAPKSSVRKAAKICPYCGQTAEKEDLFCPGCGRKLTASSIHSSIHLADEPVNPSEPEKTVRTPKAGFREEAAAEEKPRLVSTVRRKSSAPDQSKSSKSGSSPFSTPEL